MCHRYPTQYKPIWDATVCCIFFCTNLPKKQVAHNRLQTMIVNKSHDTLQFYQLVELCHNVQKCSIKPRNFAFNIQKCGVGFEKLYRRTRFRNCTLPFAHKMHRASSGKCVLCFQIDSTQRFELAPTIDRREVVSRSYQSAWRKLGAKVHSWRRKH